MRRVFAGDAMNWLTCKILCLEQYFRINRQTEGLNITNPQ
jgi:hypothetical protein